MIYTACYFEPKHQHGRLVSISQSIPVRLSKKVGRTAITDLLAPSEELLADWEKWKRLAKVANAEFPSEIHTTEYTKRYWAELKPRGEQIKAYLANHDLTQSETWLCWEKAGDFCHRNLAAKIVQKHRPEAFGGSDVESPPKAVPAPKAAPVPNPEKQGVVLATLEPGFQPEQIECGLYRLRGTDQTYELVGCVRPSVTWGDILSVQLRESDSTQISEWPLGMLEKI